MSSEDLISKLHDLQTYEVELDSRKYQVEVELLENRKDHVQIIVAVDDGSLPASLFPLTQTLYSEKVPSNYLARQRKREALSSAALRSPPQPLHPTKTLMVRLRAVPPP